MINLTTKDTKKAQRPQCLVNLVQSLVTFVVKYYASTHRQQLPNRLIKTH